MLLIIFLLDFTATISFRNCPFHTFGDIIGIHNDVTFDMARGTTDGLNKCGLGAQKAFLISIENCHK